MPWINREKIVVVAHSLAPLFLLHALSTFELELDAAIFVSPFLNLERNESHWQIDVANKSFYAHHFDYAALKAKLPLSFVLYSDQDPYVPVAKALEFARAVNSSVIPVLGARHLSSEFNQNEFPLVLELCKSRIKLTLYQKYLAHLSEYHPTDIVKQGINRALFLPSSELAKEGTFHFRNLSINGFCTLPIKEIDYWSDAQSVYMEESRKAARRVPLTRVYILEKPEDANTFRINQAMHLDHTAGINVYTCIHSNLNIPEEKLDFGIWDESYVCTVLHNTKEKTFSLDSSKEKLTEAILLKNQILSKSKIFDPGEDISLEH